MKKLLFILILLGQFLGQSVQAQSMEGYIVTSTDEYDTPMCIDFSEDGQHQFVLERDGELWLSDLESGEYVKRDTPIIDIKERVTTYFERGALTFDILGNEVVIGYTMEEDVYAPDTVNSNDATVNRVERFIMDLGSNTAISENIIVDIPSLAGNHQGLTVVYDENGYLYISTGDGASGTYGQRAADLGIIPQSYVGLDGRYLAQTIGSLNGKVLYVNPVNGEGVSTNSFYDSDLPSSNESLVYAIGFRNPFRMIYFNGELYIGDVGASRRESLKRIRYIGVNTGWGRYEGYRENFLSPNTVNPDEGELYIDLISPATGIEVSPDITQRRYVHHATGLEYQHDDEAPIRVVGFENDTLSPISTPVSFKGRSIIAGEGLQNFGYDGWILFSDIYEEKVFVAKPNNTIGFSEVVELGILSNFIVHYKQHPVTGDLYAVKLYGEIYKIEFDETLNLEEPEFEFDYSRAMVTLYDTAGKLIKSGMNIEEFTEFAKILPTNIYIAHFEYMGRVESQQVLIKN